MNVRRLCCGLLLLTVTAQAADLTSPDGRLRFRLQQRPDGQAGYAVSYRNEVVIEQARLGLETESGLRPAPGQPAPAFTPGTQKQTWKPVYGERRVVRDHWNGGVYQFKDLELDVRVYDEGVAFRYRIPATSDKNTLGIKRERTEFRFTRNHPAWCVSSAQGRYSRKPISTMGSQIERPLVVELGDAGFAAIGEAALVDFPRMKLSGKPGNTVEATLSGTATASLPCTTPWRVIMLAETPGRLLENNDLFLNLNEPCAIKDPSWIKPGKVIREVTLTTVGGKACIDFAVKNNLQFVEFDAGWYGHEYDSASDASTITVDPKRSPGPLDLHEVIRYGKERGIGILLYINRRALDKQLDQVLPLYRDWGIKGCKYGFVNVGTQRWTSWLHEAIRKAADHQLMVDVHDEYRPTGWSRTYPNLMTQEGIAGDETKPSNKQTLTILFTRMLAGAGDNTICYYDGRVDANASHAYQLAKAVCIYSPWQFLYWYDRPPAAPGSKGAGGQKNRIGDEPELEFYARVPTVWDDTKVLHGVIGEVGVIARRSGEDWFIGAMNGDTPKTLPVALNFLDPDQTYEAHLYYDDPNVATRTRVGIRHFDVHAQTVLKEPLPARGGYALHLVKKLGKQTPPQ